MGDNCIKEKDNVIFKRNDTCRSFQVRKNRQVYFEKTKFSVDELIGQMYGSTFEIDKGKLIKVDTKSSKSEYDSNVPEVSTDNRDLQDLDSNQKLSKDDIMKMKEEGLTGEKIIEELIENSETFKTKTEFSQAKYLKKKKKRHIVSFTVLRPTPRLVLKIYAKEPQKICNLRVDTLSQMLSYSNIMSGSNVGVVETCQGLLLSCILHRLGGQGKLIQFVPNTSNQVCRKAMDFFGFSKEDFDIVYYFPMSVLSDLKEKRYNELFNTEDLTKNDNVDEEEGEKEQEEEGSRPKRVAVDKELCESTSSEKTEESSKEAVSAGDDKTNVCDSGDAAQDAAGEEGGGEDEGESSKEAKPIVPTRELARRTRGMRHREAARVLMAKKLDCLIVACKYNPTPIVKSLMEFLSPSTPVVVFCQYVEPLVEIYSYIKEKKMGIQVKLSETWLREYQILPQRTHPMMNMNGNGGYLLTFTTCDATTC